MSEFKHDPVYADVEVLEKTTAWPGCVVPDWAEERANAWGCSPACSVVVEAAMKFEIKRLRRQIFDHTSTMSHVLQLLDEHMAASCLRNQGLKMKLRPGKKDAFCEAIDVLRKALGAPL